MATPEDELKGLKEKNNELVQKVQFWKMTAAQKENEKLDLMKEINDLRLKVIRLKSGGAAEARKLDAALQTASEEALSHLVQASSAVARTIELAKTYMRDRQELETMSPRWSNMSNSTEKVHRVPPMMMGGQSIQPVVSLSRTLNLSAQRPVSRSPSSRNVSVRAVPMHMLQDVYIPLTRIDMRDIPTNNHNETEPEAATADDSGENMPFDVSMEEAADESRNTTDEDGFESSQRLDIVTEDLEPEDEVLTPPRPRADPLEGPSWLLDSLAARRRPLEPDSTTHGEEPAEDVHPAADTLEAPRAELAREFTPTVRRKRGPPPSPPAPSPPAASPAPNNVKQIPNERILQVLVPKMRLDNPDVSPPKRSMPFDAPSPNGATDSRVIVSEQTALALERRSSPEHKGAGDGPAGAAARGGRGRDSADSDSGSGPDRVSEGRTRRNRKPVTYKEKPLNRKLRR